MKTYKVWIEIEEYDTETEEGETVDGALGCASTADFPSLDEAIEPPPGTFSNIPAPAQAQHSPICASLPNSKASKHLGKCYCDCGADETVTDWKLWEEIDSITIFPANVDPDDLSFGRARPICTIPLSTPFKFAKLIANAPQTAAHAQRLADALADCETSPGALAERSHEYALRRLATITETAREALAEWSKAQ